MYERSSFSASSPAIGIIALCYVQYSNRYVVLLLIFRNYQFSLYDWYCDSSLETTFCLHSGFLSMNSMAYFIFMLIF